MTARKSGFIVGAVAGAGVACAALAGMGMRMGTADAAPAQVTRASTAVAPTFAPPPGAPMSFADIFEKVSPAVVQINVTSKAKAPSLRIPGLEGFDIVPRGQRRPGQPGQDQQDEDGDTPATPKQQSAGSGFFISADGYIVTNNHVVDKASEVQIVTDDGKTLEAKVIGTDPRTDLALLKVNEGGSFPFVQLATAKPRIGDWVLAVGNPFGLGGTVTAGIVSAQGRDIGSGPYDDFLQIDAAVNRGNSGGPTFNQKGEVVGVNTAIFSPSGGNVGIAFAVPASTVEQVVTALKKDGTVARGFIGVQIQPVTAEVAEAIGLKEAHGALVAAAERTGPAARQQP